MYLITLIFCSLFLFSSVKGHALLYEPPNRSSVWRFPEFEFLNPVVNNEDNQLYCGGLNVQHGRNNGKCGLCGDDYSKPRPRDNESGGKYDKNIIVRNYTTGSHIKTSTFITANHLGYFQFSLCVRNSRFEIEDEFCFNKYPLPLSDGTGFKSFPVFIGQTLGYFNVTVSLPPIIKCTHCVLRWQYITGNTWGICGYVDGPNGTQITVTDTGCGPQEEFRGCADIGIY